VATVAAIAVPRSRAGAADSRISRAAAWLAPDLAMVAAIATLICLFVSFGGSTALFRDSDAGWHIRNGEAILSSHRLPDADAFSFSKSGAPWFAWEWASDVLTGAIHRAAGLRGFAAFYGLAIATSVWMWFRLTWAVGGNFLIAALFAAPMIVTTDLHWLARPHVFGWLFALGAVWWCERAPCRPGAKDLAGIAIGSALWANMHGSFVLGPLIILIYAIVGRTRNLVPALLAATAGSFINPHGWMLHRHIAAYLFDASLLDRIGEFQSFNFHHAGAWWVIVSLIAGIAGGCAALFVRRPERFILSVMLTGAALTSARSLPLAALLLLPLANGSITEAGLPFTKALRYGDSLRAFDRSFHGFALVPFIALVLFGMRLPAAFPPADFPVAASAAISSLPGDARIFSTDKFGGYLIYRLDGARKVFFDGRSDFYGADFVTRYARMIEARPGWRTEFARWNFTHALLPPDSALLAALEDSGWRELRRDTAAVLIARREE
jgi:hypothetical protein